MDAFTRRGERGSTCFLIRPNAAPIGAGLAVRGAATSIVRQERLPAVFRERKELIVLTFFVVTAFTSHRNVTGYVQPYTGAVRSIQMLHRRAVTLQFPTAIQTAPPESSEDGFCVTRIGYRHPTRHTCLPAHLVQEHAHQLVCHVGFRSPCGLPQSRRNIKVHSTLLPILAGPPLVSMPSNHLTSTFNARAKAASSKS